MGLAGCTCSQACCVTLEMLPTLSGPSEGNCEELHIPNGWWAPKQWRAMWAQATAGHLLARVSKETEVQKGVASGRSSSRNPGNGGWKVGGVESDLC
ncbi:hypothetical protein I79_013852 [Cricetulus griseus]|uniref:Uncharacterized protein n=1 Tax=Cricetulus griseus TaxID=10029 RepID=G3HSL8_CRIGR|nr:hypothetical protein I79_013852 [Cricetulus griseus]